MVRESVPPNVDLPAVFRNELVAVDAVEAMRPDLIIVESRLFDGDMRVPWPVLEALVSSGAQLLFLNCRDPQQLSHAPDGFFGCRVRTEDGDVFQVREEGTYNTIAGNPSFISADPTKMPFLFDEFKPAYEGVRAIACRGAVVQEAFAGVLAMAEPTARVQSSSGWWRDDVDLPVFASVRGWGVGHVVVVTADMTSNDVLRECPANLLFFENLLLLLNRESLKKQAGDGRAEAWADRASVLARSERDGAAPERLMQLLEMDEETWAAALAWINHRRVLLERNIRRLIRQVLAAVEGEDGSTWSDAVLAALRPERRADSAGVTEDALLDRLYWLELSAIIGKYWRHFELLGDKRRIRTVFEVLNDRPDAHAKPADLADFALQRRELLWLETQVQRALAAGAG